jgi:hypothetical protein
MLEFASYRMSYVILTGHWCHIIALIVHTPNDVKDNFYEELERVFNKFPEYLMNGY